MNRQPTSLPGSVWLLTLAVLCSGTAVGQNQAPTTDPVEQVRWTLQHRVKPTERELELVRWSKQLATITSLRQALALSEWRDDEPDPYLAPIDGQARLVLIKRFEERLHAVLQGHDATRQLAAARLLGEMGIQVRGKKGQTSLTATLAPDLARLVKARQSSVSEAAAWALGRVYASPAVTVPPLAELLRTGDGPQRTAAAEALSQSIQVVAELAGPHRRWPSVASANRADLIRTVRAVLPVVSAGRSDNLPTVRCQAMRALKETAAALRVQAESGTEDHEPLAAADRRIKLRKRLEADQQELRPLAQALREQIPGAVASLEDSDRPVCLAATQALETTAEARLVLLQHRDRLMEVAGDKTVEGPATDVLEYALLSAVDPIAELLTNSDVRLRLAALYVLETLHTDAAPAVAAVAKVTRDENSFVRWAAARTLGRMAPREPVQAVPALARLAEDPNGDVRLTALAGLERFGPAAKAAVPELRRSCAHREAATRVWTLRALTALGKEAGPALPEVVQALAATEAEVRLGAARVLARIGPLDEKALEALRKALQDSDAAVRTAASDALLSGL